MRSSFELNTSKNAKVSESVRSSQVWELASVIPVLGKLRQENFFEFEASPDYKMSLRKCKNKEKKEEFVAGPWEQFITPSVHFRQTSEQNQNQPKVDRRKEIIKQEWKSLKLNSRNNRGNACLLGKSNKTDTKMRQKIGIINIRKWNSSLWIQQLQR